MRMSFSEIGKYLKEKRRLSGYTQQQVSDHLGYDSAQFVSNWERGQCLPPTSSLRKLIKLLDIPGDELINLILSEKKLLLESAIKSKPTANARALIKQASGGRARR